MSSSTSSNFFYLQVCDEQLVFLGALAEKYVATKMGTHQTEKEESQYELLCRLRDENVLPQDIYQLFGEVQRVGNVTNHATQGDSSTALNVLKSAGNWGCRGFARLDKIFDGQLVKTIDEFNDLLWKYEVDHDT